MAEYSDESLEERSGGEGSANKTIERYIENARRKARLRQSTRDKSKSKVADKKIKEPSDGQLMVPIGVMYHCDKRGRGVQVKGSKMTNILLRTDCSYKRMLAKCVGELYSEEEQQQYDFYIADTQGIAVWNGDSIAIDMESGDEKAKFFCVKREKELSSSNATDSEEEGGTKIQVTRDDGSSKRFTRTSKEPPRKRICKTPVVAAPDVEKKSTTSSESVDLSPNAEVEIARPIPPADSDSFLKVWKPFEPLYIVVKKSRYAENWAFTTVNQRQALFYATDDGDEARQDLESEERVGLLPENPLNFKNVFFAGIECLGSDFLLEVETCDPGSGKVYYKKPRFGDCFDVWRGGFSCPGDRVAIMACVALSGYHSISKYQWYRGTEVLVDESNPILYVQACGTYKCTINTKDLGEKEYVFSVELMENIDNCWSVKFDSKFSSLPDIARRRLSQMSGIDTSDPNNLILCDRIGQGSFGTVYSASWRGTLIAAKVIPVQFETTVVKGEIDILRKVQHPNISNFLGIEEVENGLAILSPLVRGINLHSFLFESDKKFSLPEKLYISIQVCQAIVYLHTCTPPLAHLDIKPANILIDPITIKATLTDFGLSHVMSGTAVIGTKTMMAGTPGYQAPEQLKAESVGIHTDVYAYGCVIITLYQEEVLWKGLTQYQILCKVTIEKAKPEMTKLSGEMLVIARDCLLPSSERPLIQHVLQKLLQQRSQY